MSAARATAEHARRLHIVLAMVVGFLVVQVAAGLLTGSLALLSDAGHMATDALGIAMSVAAIHAASAAAKRPGTNHRTFGLYRLEILAALANSVLLIGVGAYVLFEAVRRLQDPEEIAALPLLVIGALGLTLNVMSMVLLRRGAEDSLNVRGAYLEVVADALGSLGVLVGAAVIALTGWTWVDPVVGAAIGLFIVPRAWRLGRDAIRVLVQAAPADLDPGDVRAALAAVDGVAGVHDLHVWTLTSDMDVVTAHLAVGPSTDGQRVLVEAQRVLATRFGLTHATLQVESSDPCDHPDW